jgi:DNA-directed RNA polymerase beta' subunit
MTLEQTLESLVKKKLSDVREYIGSNCQALLKKDNRVLTMFLCGAKGSNINLSQMVGCVGQ